MKTTTRLFNAVLIAAVGLLAGHSAKAGAPAGFAPVLELGAEQLTIRGSGTVHYARLIRVYDAVLYAPAGRPAADLVEGSTPRCLQIEYRRAVRKDIIIEAADTVLRRQGVPVAALQGRLDRLKNAYRDVGPGDRYQLCHAPGGDTRLSLNGEELIRIPGEDFAVAYFGIWLRDGAISDELRSALLADGAAPTT